MLYLQCLHLTFNQRVEGSIPSRLTTKKYGPEAEYHASGPIQQGRNRIPVYPSTTAVASRLFGPQR